MEAELAELKSKFPESVGATQETVTQEQEQEQEAEEIEEVEEAEEKVDPLKDINDEVSKEEETDNFEDFLGDYDNKKKPPFQKKSFTQTNEAKLAELKEQLKWALSLDNVDNTYVENLRKQIAEVENKIKKSVFDATQKKGKSKKKFEGDAANETIAENPGLFDYIKGVLKKAFPNVSVEMVDSMLEKYGVDALGSAFKNSVNIQKDSAQQTTILHEFAHIYIDLLGRNHPLVKLGLELVKGTELHRKAKENYPELSEQDQLMEALVESVAIKGLSRLRTNFEGTNFDKFKAWATRFWNRIRGLFNSKYYNEIDAITRKMLNGSVKDKTGLNPRVQFQKKLSNAYSQAVNLATTAIAGLRMSAVRDSSVNYDKLNTVKAEIYSAFYQRYLDEKNNDIVTTNPIFNDINLKEPTIQEFYKAVKENKPDVFEFVENASNSASTVSRFLSEQEGQDEGLKQPDTENHIKANKGFSPSVKSVLSSMVDNQGHPIDTNEVFRFVATIASNSLSAEDFFQRVKERRDRNSNNLISDRVYNILKSMPSDDRQLLIFEMSNTVQTPFKKFAFLENYKGKGEEKKNKLVIKQLNKDYEAGETAKAYLINIKTFSDQDAEETKKQMFGDVAPYNRYSLGSLIRPSGYFGQRFAKNKIPTEQDRKRYNQLVSSLLNENVPVEYTDSVIDKKHKPGETYTPAQNLLSRLYSQTKAKDKPPFVAKDIDSHLSKIAKEVEGYESLVNNFINSKGENVTTTSVGHSMTDVIKRYRDDVASPKRNN
jgi:hypothetical protein